MLLKCIFMESVPEMEHLAEPGLEHMTRQKFPKLVVLH